tara:strand:- start:1643 stop:2536 length:894 start_codon:yes stop_codon:yes gene_type:complete
MHLLKILLVFISIYVCNQLYKNENVNEGLIQTPDKEKSSDLLPPAVYDLFGTPDNKQGVAGKKFSAQVKYTSNTIMEFINIDHDSRSEYKYNPVEKSYINLENPHKFIVYDKEDKTIIVHNKNEVAKYDIIFMEKSNFSENTSDEEKKGTISEGTVPSSYSDVINMSSAPSIGTSNVVNDAMNKKKSNGSLLNPFLNQYYIGYSRKDTWLLALSKQDEMLLQKAFPIERTEQLNIRKENTPITETYYFSLLSGFQLFMESITKEERTILVQHLKKLRIIVENRNVFEKADIFSILSE